MTAMSVLWVPHTAWRVPQRARLYAPRLAALDYDIHVTDWDAQFRSPRDYLSLRYIRNYLPWSATVDQVHVHHVPRVSPALYVPALRRLNTSIYERAVAQLIRDHNVSSVIGSFVVPPPRARRLVFDAFDDNVAYWRTYGATSAYAEEIAATEAAYLDRADVVIAVSEVLRDRIAARMKRALPIHVVPNGVDLARFQGAARQGGTAVRARHQLDGPVVGIVGNHDRPNEIRRVVDAIAAVDRELALLIVGGGASLADGLAYARARGLRQVVSVGQIPHEQVPMYMAAMNIGMCPYRKTPADDARSPMRLVEYLAAGLLVVSSELDSVRSWDLPNVILVPDTVAGFVEGLRQALRQSPLPIRGELDAFDLPMLTERLAALVTDGA